jgi:aryl-alcohol dehydrogenase-like predicted oxidoreductase
VEVLREIGKAHDVEPGVVAIAWTLRHPAITAAIVGTASRPGGWRTTGGDISPERRGN